MTHVAHKFNVLDDLSLVARSSLLVLCALTCCWGFVNDTILLVFASKIGFPMAVAICSVTVDRKRSLTLVYYTVLLCATGYEYFRIEPGLAIKVEIIGRYNPDPMDFYLATGLGYALSAFWNHPIRINLIVASAGLASLLPACVMAGYCLQRGLISMAFDSLTLYGEYVGGLAFGATLHQGLEWLTQALRQLAVRKLPDRTKRTGYMNAPSFMRGGVNPTGDSGIGGRAASTIPALPGRKRLSRKKRN